MLMLTFPISYAILHPMNNWWSPEQDLVWSRAPWSKRIDEESKNINWTLEVTTEPNHVKMGYIIIHGTLSGDLTLSLYSGQELAS